MDAIVAAQAVKNLKLRSEKGRARVHSRLFSLQKLNRAVTDLFDDRRTQEEFSDSVDRLAKAMKDYRPEIIRK